MSFGNQKAQSKRWKRRYSRDEKRIEEISKNSHLRVTVNYQGQSYEVYQSLNGEVWAFRMSGVGRKFIKSPSDVLLKKSREKLDVLYVKHVMES